MYLTAHKICFNMFFIPTYNPYRGCKAKEAGTHGPSGGKLQPLHSHKKVITPIKNLPSGPQDSFGGVGVGNYNDIVIIALIN